jgi:hypothetical protein
MNELTQAIADRLPDWSRETMDYKHDIVATIVKRLMDGGLSETTIRNMLLVRHPTVTEASPAAEDGLPTA